MARDRDIAEISTDPPSHATLGLLPRRHQYPALRAATRRVSTRRATGYIGLWTATQRSQLAKHRGPSAWGGPNFFVMKTRTNWTDTSTPRALSICIGLTLHLGPYTTGEYSAVTPSYDPLLRDTYHLLMTGQICLEGLVHADPRIHSRAQLLMHPFARHILLARALLFQCYQLSKIIALAPSCRGC